jgi:hypothetical protein
MYTIYYSNNVTGGGVEMEKLAGVTACQQDDVIKRNWHG